MSIAALYNSLPDLKFANDAFIDRDVMFGKLAPLLAAYQFQFGLCLVHAHCALNEGEAMVASGNISRPVRGGPRYPERWLSDGTAYEFNQEPTIVPPPELIRDFQAIVGKDTVLGLYYSGDVQGGKIWLEHTEGRDNVVELVDRDREITPILRSSATRFSIYHLVEISSHVETGWLPGTDAPLTMTCAIVCVGTEEDHTKPHQKVDPILPS
ncbi:hypothetical protein B0J17DRAFT_581992 [Rhizoctonia solani]|nr:hypothetical protein B0J17DRAFT_581992 [Rhizoctonia solani]